LEKSGTTFLIKYDNPTLLSTTESQVYNPLHVIKIVHANRIAIKYIDYSPFEGDVTWLDVLSTENVVVSIGSGQRLAGLLFIYRRKILHKLYIFSIALCQRERLLAFNLVLIYILHMSHTTKVIVKNISDSCMFFIFYSYLLDLCYAVLFIDRYSLVLIIL